VFALRAVYALRRPASLLALVALALQLAAASIVLPAAPAAALDGLITASICHAGSAHDEGKAPLHHPPPACDLCALCQAVAHAGTLLAASDVVLTPPVLPAMRAAPPLPAWAPPEYAVASTWPRGPPHLT
jgi:hypothetical protein